MGGGAAQNLRYGVCEVDLIKKIPYSDRQVCRSSVDTDKTPQNSQIRVYTVCHSPSNFRHIHR